MKIISIALCAVCIIPNAKAVELVATDCVEHVCITEYDPEHEEYLKKVLTAMNLAYSVRTRDGHNVVIWKSASKEQEEEVMARVSEYFFVRDICPNHPLPAPEQPSNPDIWCKQ